MTICKLVLPVTAAVCMIPGLDLHSQSMPRVFFLSGFFFFWLMNNLKVATKNSFFEGIYHY